MGTETPLGIIPVVTGNAGHEIGLPPGCRQLPLPTVPLPRSFVPGASAGHSCSWSAPASRVLTATSA
jgi:hypothetical protein